MTFSVFVTCNHGHLLLGDTSVFSFFPAETVCCDSIHPEKLSVDGVVKMTTNTACAHSFKTCFSSVNARSAKACLKATSVVFMPDNYITERQCSAARSLGLSVSRESQTLKREENGQS